jgi:hypothetical protein
MSSEDERDPKPPPKGIVIVPTKVRDLDFSKEAARPAPAGAQRKPVPLNPSPLPQGGAIPEDEVLPRKDEG